MGVMQGVRACLQAGPLAIDHHDMVPKMLETDFGLAKCHLSKKREQVGLLSMPKHYKTEL